MSVPREVVVQVLREQGGLGQAKAVCPCCKRAGLCSDPHHWLYKRNHNIPDDVADCATNIVMLCHKCHIQAGQSKEMTKSILLHKLEVGYDVFGWVEMLIQNNVVRHRPDIYHYQVIWRKTMLNKENRVKAFVQIITAIQRPAHMMLDRSYEGTVSFVGHPFDASRDVDLWTFVGMSSDDIYPLVYHALAPSSSPITGLRFWLVPQKEDAFHHQIFAEIETEFETFMCSGLTDYSGSGGAAYETCKQMFEFLSAIYELTVEIKIAKIGQDDKLWNDVAIATAEERGDD